jgi:hypothetical protein
MQASDLYPWGEELDESSRALALATIGVWIASVGAPDLASFLRVARDQRAPQLATRIAGERRVPWDIAPLLAASVAEREELERIQPAGVLADLWIVANTRREAPPRLEVRSRWDRLDRYAWAVEQLSGLGVGATPFVAAKLTAERANWQWPVRLGIPAGRRADSLYGTLRPVVKWDELVEWVEVDGPDTPCDVLILETGKDVPLEPLVPYIDDLDVGCILAFADGISGANLNPDTELRGFLLRNRVRAWGVGLIDLAAARAGHFLHELVRQMSHDTTLDVGLAFASRAHVAFRPAALPILFAVPRALDEAHLTEFAGRLVDMLATANGGGPELPSEVRGGALPPGGPVDHVVLREAIGNRGNFRYEEHGATTVARAARATRSRAAETVAPARPRRIQTEVFGRNPTARSGRDRFSTAVTGALGPETEYEIEVSIRYPREGAVQADAEVDLSSLPQDRRTHRLDVAFQELGGTEPAQRGRIVIRADEESTATRFSFQTRSGTFRARIIVSYRNRILQMVRFEADIMPAEAARPVRRKRDPQRLRVESNARASMSDLSHRRTFDFAMVANHADGDPVLGLLKKGAYQQFGAGDISGELKWLEDTLTRLATQVGPLTSKRNQALLRDLAIRGRRIFNHINSWNRGRKPLQPHHGRIQIVDGSPDAFFPIEFVYDRPMPSNDAKLCPKAKQALRDGVCPADCPPAGRESEVICPLGFWGLSLVIERHAFMPGRVDKDIVALVAEPATGRNTLRPFGGAAYAASDRADAVKKGSIKLVGDAIERAVGRPTKVLRTWAEWTRSVETDAPPLLVLICHTDEQQRAGQPAVQIEIGAANPRRPEWLDVDAVDAAYVVGPAGTPNPVVLLIQGQWQQHRRPRRVRREPSPARGRCTCGSPAQDDAAPARTATGAVARRVQAAPSRQQEERQPGLDRRHSSGEVPVLDERRGLQASGRPGGVSGARRCRGSESAVVQLRQRP